MKYDAIVVGSGFGGSVVALRLAEAGLRVAVLERGPWWAPSDFPRTTLDLLRRGQRTRLSPDGLFDVRRFDGISVYAGNGVGGGSLVYSNALVRPPDAVLDAFPPGLRARDLGPRFARVLAMLKPAHAPDLPKSAHLRRLAERLGEGSWRPLDLAVTFEGPRACVGCGLCNIGCHVHAKNTLDLTYIPAAVRAGAEVLARAKVERIEPVAGDDGYRVWFRHRSSGGRGERRYLVARRVVLAAGSVGSTELLLRGRARGDLPRLSGALGSRFSANGDHLAHAYGAAEPPEGRLGPIIASGIDFGDVLIEDGGVPELFTGLIARTVPGIVDDLEWVYRSLAAGRGFGAALGALASMRARVAGPPVDERTVTFCVMARDAADGSLYLDGGGRLRGRWRWNRSERAVRRVNDLLARLGKAAGARVAPNPIRRDARAHTVHPLGGCPIGESAREAVVSPDGEAFGHSGLYVADGAIVPAAVGVNPSLTIAALAETIGEGIVAAAGAARENR